MRNEEDGVYEEGDRVFDFSRAVSSERFDGKRHRLSHCMCATDFIVETSSALLLIEVKNLNRGPEAHKDCAKYMAKVQRQDPFINEIVPKFRDTWIYLWCEDRLVKPVRCLVYLELPPGMSYSMEPLSSKLAQGIPLRGGETTGRWKREIAQSALVLDCETWTSTQSTL